MLGSCRLGMNRRYMQQSLAIVLQWSRCEYIRSTLEVLAFGEAFHNCLKAIIADDLSKFMLTGRGRASRLTISTASASAPHPHFEVTVANWLLTGTFSARPGCGKPSTLTPFLNNRQCELPPKWNMPVSSPFFTCWPSFAVISHVLTSSIPIPKLLVSACLSPTVLFMEYAYPQTPSARSPGCPPP